MVLTILPRDPEISFEYHFFGALAGVIAAIWLRRLDPLPPRKRYSWEDEEADEALPVTDDELEPPSPRDVPVLWQRPARDSEDNVIRFPPRGRDGPTVH
jgi:hypothetical protein